MDERHSTRDTTLAVGALVSVVGGAFAVIPEIDTVWKGALAIAVALAIGVPSAIYIVRRVRHAAAPVGAEAEVTRYEEDVELGVLRKGTIENVSLRVESLHALLDNLVQQLPSDDEKRSALYRGGCAAGVSWSSDFKNQFRALGLEAEDRPRQFLKWANYDATAGMGRLTVGVDPETAEGLVIMSRSFLARQDSCFPLDWWLAGYIAGTLTELLGRTVSVSPKDPSKQARSTSIFLVSPAV